MFPLVFQVLMLQGRGINEKYKKEIYLLWDYVRVKKNMKILMKSNCIEESSFYDLIFVCAPAQFTNWGVNFTQLYTHECIKIIIIFVYLLIK